MKSKFSIIMLLIFSLFFSISCNDTEINSTWRTKEIKIDGNRSEWEGSLKYYEDEKAAIGIMNDNDFIYFCLITADRSKIMKILHNGFTVWLDPQDSDGKTYGIQYPIRKEMSSDRNQMMEPERRFDSDNIGSNIGERKDMGEGSFSQMMIDKFKAEQNEILIVNEDNYPLNTFTLHTQNGLEASINFESNQLVYELKVPIANNKKSEFFTDVIPKEKLEVTFESGEMKRSQFNNEKGEGGRGGMRTPTDGDEDGMNTGRGRRGGSINDRAGGRDLSDFMKPIDFSIMVKLATK